MHGVVREAFTWVAVLGGLAYGVLHLDRISELNAYLMGQEPAAAGQKPAGRLTMDFSKLRARATEERPPQQTRSPSGMSVELASDSRGHFEARAEINGRDISALVDTGASAVVLTYEDAERAGMFPRPSDFTQVVATANGTARYAPVMIDSVTIGDITVRNIPGAVSEPGRLHRTLLGMSFLGRVSNVGMRNGVLVLQD